MLFTSPLVTPVLSLDCLLLPSLLGGVVVTPAKTQTEFTQNSHTGSCTLGGGCVFRPDKICQTHEAREGRYAPCPAPGICCTRHDDEPPAMGRGASWRGGPSPSRLLRAHSGERCREMLEPPSANQELQHDFGLPFCGMKAHCAPARHHTALLRRPSCVDRVLARGSWGSRGGAVVLLSCLHRSLSACC